MASPPKKKKLPFKPTALRRSAPKPTPVADDNGSDDDGLSLFRRSKEMAPIVAADRERRMKRAAQKQRELDSKTHDNEPRSSGGEKRPHEDDDGPSFFDEPRSDGTEPRAAEAESSRAMEEPATQTIQDRARFAFLCPFWCASTKNHTVNSSPLPRPNDRDTVPAPTRSTASL